MTKHKVSELEGALLDAAVAKAEGLPIHPGRGFIGRRGDTVYAHERHFSMDWSHGGPIIERERMMLDGDIPSGWVAICPSGTEAKAYGCTALVAAMRAYVISKFGDEVDL